MMKSTDDLDAMDGDYLIDRLAKYAKEMPEKKVFHFLGTNGNIDAQLTYQQLDNTTSEVAQRLIESGLNRGDRAVLVYPPSLDFMVAFLACLKTGVVAVPVFPPNPTRRDTLHMFANICGSSGATHALTSTEYNQLKNLANLKNAFTIKKRNNGTKAEWPEQLSWVVTNNKSKPKNSFDPLAQPPIKSSDLAFLQYTSGSTSDPKGVMITHGNLRHNLTSIILELAADKDTIVVSWLPQYHDMGLIGSYLGILYCGGTGYYISPLSFLQRPAVWMESVSKFHATHLQAPNFAFRLAARKFEEQSTLNSQRIVPLDLSSVRHVINAAEPVDIASIRAFEAAFGPYGFPKGVIFPTYGLAEHTVFVSSGGRQVLTVDKAQLEVDGKVVEAEEQNDSANTSSMVGCGNPKNQNIDVRIVDHESCKELPHDAVGEIWINSPSKAAGYFGRPEDSEEAFQAKLADDGDSRYLRTGDLGFLHQDELFICGRLKDLIIVAGRNYYPQDIEGTAEATSDKLRPGCSAAFTIDTTGGGNEKVAIVMELRDPDLSKEQCIELCDAIRGAVNAEHSLGLTCVALLRTRTVPKTTSGKIARAWCRKGFLNKTLQIVHEKRWGENPMSPMEIDQGNPSAAAVDMKPPSADRIQELRSMSNKELKQKIRADVARVASVRPNDIDVDAPLVTMMDSLSLSQFKGLFESSYSIRPTLSDEYLFRDSTTVTKLVDIVKMGQAPDDHGGDEPGATSTTTTSTHQQQGTAGGLAGALGCPPGVCCVIQ